MNWNYRIIKKSVDNAEAYAICEVYYDEAGKPVMCSTPIAPFGTTTDELKMDMERMMVALSMAVLEETVFVGLQTEGKDEQTPPDEVK